jgi:anti-sigma regulatory factor (Ser/Thr protein kinase)/ABC-type transporter Mla MlaB component
MVDFLSLTGDLTHETAVQQLLQRTTSQEPDTPLCFQAPGVTRVDAACAAAILTRIERHLVEHPDGPVTLAQPRDPNVAGRLLAMLDLPADLARHVTITGQVTPRIPSNYALVPATAIPDPYAAAALGEYLLEACDRAGVPDQRSRFAAIAAVELAENALTHATDPAGPPVVVVTATPRAAAVELAVLDTGTGISGAADAAEILRTLPRHALDGNAGFLGDIMRRAREARQRIHVHVLSGTARLRWTPLAHRTEQHLPHVPGTTVIVRVTGELPDARSSTTGA